MFKTYILKHIIIFELIALRNCYLYKLILRHARALCCQYLRLQPATPGCSAVGAEAPHFQLVAKPKAFSEKTFKGIKARLAVGKLFLIMAILNASVVSCRASP